MQLTHLGIRNFRVIRRADIDITDDITGIIGSNGVGKSSLVEAISWALYGNQAARSGKGEIKRQTAATTDECQVKLVFSARGVAYEVVRRLIGPTQRQEVQISSDGQTVALGVKDSLDFVQCTLGLTFGGFLTSFLARQQELSTLSDVPPAKRRDHLAAMLGVEQIDTAIVRAKGDNRVFAGQATTLERQLAGFEDLDRRIDTAGQSLGQIEAGTSKLKRSMLAASKEASEASKQLERWQKKHTRWILLGSQVKAEQEIVASLRHNIDNLSVETTRLQKEESTKAGLYQRLAELTSAPERLEKVRGCRQKLELRRKGEVRQLSLRRELDTVALDLTRVQATIVEHRSDVAAASSDIEDLCAQASKDLENLRNEYAECKGEKLAGDSELATIETQIAQVGELGSDSVCERCRRPLGDDLPRVREHLNCERQELLARAATAQKELSDKERQGTKARLRLDNLTGQARKRREALVALESRTSEAKILSKQKVAREAEIGTLQKEIEAWGQVDFDPDDEEKLKGQVQALKTLSAEVANLDGRLQRLPEAIAERDGLQTKLIASQAKLADLQSELKKLEFDPEQYAGAGRRYTKTQAEHDAARTNLLTHEKEVELSRVRLDELLRQKEQLTRTQKELEESRSDRYHGEKLVSLLAQYRHEIVSNIRPRLGGLSTGLFDEMTGGKYNLVELDDKYNLRIFDNGEFFGVERFSGGEKDLANLCLRLSISLSLTESAGLDRSFIILDEVFGSQDDERKELVISSLKRLLVRFPQILLITHVEDIKDRVGRLIQVVPTGRGYSEVVVDGVVV